MYEVESRRRSLGLAEGAFLRGLCLHPPTDLWKAEFTVTNWSAWQKNKQQNSRAVPGLPFNFTKKGVKVPSKNRM